jgi:hypothetical protein
MFNEASDTDEEQREEKKGRRRLEGCGEDYAIFIAKKCRTRRNLHNDARAWYHTWFNIVTITSFILSFVIAGVSQLPFDGEWFKYTLLLLALGTTTTTAVVRFLGFEFKQFEHHLAANKYLRLRDVIRVYICTLPSKREPTSAFLRNVSDHYENIVSSSPPIVELEDKIPLQEDAPQGAALAELLCDGCQE